MIQAITGTKTEPMNPDPVEKIDLNDPRNTNSKYHWLLAIKRIKDRFPGGVPEGSLEEVQIKKLRKRIEVLEKMESLNGEAKAKPE